MKKGKFIPLTLAALLALANCAEPSPKPKDNPNPNPKPTTTQPGQTNPQNCPAKDTCATSFENHMLSYENAVLQECLRHKCDEEHKLAHTGLVRPIFMGRFNKLVQSEPDNYSLHNGIPCTTQNVNGYDINGYRTHSYYYAIGSPLGGTLNALYGANHIQNKDYNLQECIDLPY